MAGQWKEVVRLCFRGERFRDHALDLSALAELSEFQKLVSETAKALWRAANPERERLPGHFEERVRLCLRRIEEGSAEAPLEVYVEEPGQLPLWEEEPHEPEELREAIDLAHDVFEAVCEETPLPERLPRELVPQYAKWGQSLVEDEEVELIIRGRRPARVSPRHRELLAAFIERPYEDVADVVGEVFEADVRQKRFQLWIDNQPAAVWFAEEHEELVTTALRDHRSVRLRVTGRAEYSPGGDLQRFISVDSLDILRAGQPTYDERAPSIEEVLSSLAAEVPQEEWARLPGDLTDDLDYYLYGTSRR